MDHPTSETVQVSPTPDAVELGSHNPQSMNNPTSDGEPSHVSEQCPGPRSPSKSAEELPFFPHEFFQQWQADREKLFLELEEAELRLAAMRHMTDPSVMPADFGADTEGDEEESVYDMEEHNPLMFFPPGLSRLPLDYPPGIAGMPLPSFPPLPTGLPHHLLETIFDDADKGDELETAEFDEESFMREYQAIMGHPPPSACLPQLLPMSFGALPPPGAPQVPSSLSEGFPPRLLESMPCHHKAISDHTCKGTELESGKDAGEDDTFSDNDTIRASSPPLAGSPPLSEGFSSLQELVRSLRAGTAGEIRKETEAQSSDCASENEDVSGGYLQGPPFSSLSGLYPTSVPPTAWLPAVPFPSFAGLPPLPACLASHPDLKYLESIRSLHATSDTIDIGKGKGVKRGRDEDDVQDIWSRYEQIMSRALDPDSTSSVFRRSGPGSLGSFANYRRSPSTCLHCAPGHHRYRGPGESTVCQAAEASGSGTQHH